ncbi:hypothetical protein HDK90DRAFT_500100 [Phyllosticta capitalensis]|uniref:Secreted protein n=1 Tax=Phyllosticta capitalensis TaxID=121624 RepID=A0ABR1YAQ1_9PEZI
MVFFLLSVLPRVSTASLLLPNNHQSNPRAAQSAVSLPDCSLSPFAPPTLLSPSSSYIQPAATRTKTRWLTPFSNCTRKPLTSWNERKEEAASTRARREKVSCVYRSRCSQARAKAFKPVVRHWGKDKEAEQYVVAS